MPATAPRGRPHSLWRNGRQRRALAPTFRAGVMLLFIPSRGARAPTGTRSVSRQTRSCRLPADVADFFLANSGSGRTLELGRRAADADAGGGCGSMRATGSSTTPGRNRLTLRAHRRALAPTFRLDVMLLFIPWRGGAARRQAQVGQQTDPLVPAAGRRRRFSFSRNSGSGQRWSSGDRAARC